MKLTRKHLRDLIIEEVSEKKTMVPSSIKNNYLALSQDEGEQDWAQRLRIPVGVIPHGYVLLEDNYKAVIVMTRDDAVALSRDIFARMFEGETKFGKPNMRLIWALGITHIVTSHYNPSPIGRGWRRLTWSEEVPDDHSDPNSGLSVQKSAYITPVDGLE